MKRMACRRHTRNIGSSLAGCRRRRHSHHRCRLHIPQSRALAGICSKQAGRQRFCAAHPIHTCFGMSLHARRQPLLLTVVGERRLLLAGAKPPSVPHHRACRAHIAPPVCASCLQDPTALRLARPHKRQAIKPPAGQTAMLPAPRRRLPSLTQVDPLISHEKVDAACGKGKR